ncbi:MAG: peptide chain release factor N(5)-glutamine methyltransferase [Clostridia bacterium]|jgi:release factor glutamine methyltransferase|nr:peptide chain release factor N(5)-glutamine methyltransferase [Clostridia bacterium]MBR2645911.1 peptide chain release factor N(5)-glutamine methyltransferase [Clostridia bacterium]
MIVRKAEQAIAKRLREVAGEDAQLEATFLLRASGFHSPYQELTETDAKALEPLIERRLSGEPLPYVLGEWEFYGLPFYVDRNVLIPRPDTECLVEAALKELTPERNTVLDLCCGSGCIGIALAVCGGAKVTAADISADALDFTERNARRNGVSVELIRSDFLDEIEGPFDLIACNPPYLSMEDMENRDAALRCEPELALYGGFDGLAFYHRLAKEYRRVLKPGGTLLMEIGMTQREAVESLFPGATCIMDYGGRPRVIVVKEHD